MKKSTIVYHKKRCADIKQDACNIYNNEARNKMLKQLPHSNTITQEGILEIQKNTRDHERKKRLQLQTLGLY